MSEERSDMYRVVRALGGDVNAKIRDAIGVDGGLVADPVELVEYELFIDKMHRLGVEYPERESKARKLIIAEGVRENLRGLDTDLSKLAVMHGHKRDESIDVDKFMKKIMGVDR